MILNVLSQACARSIDELRQRRARGGGARVGELAEDVVGFVEEDQAGHGGAWRGFSGIADGIRPQLSFRNTVSVEPKGIG